MPDAQEEINAAIGEVVKARSSIRRGKSKQVNGDDEVSYLQAVVYSWTRTHRPIVAAHPSSPNLDNVDSAYNQVLLASGKSAARTTYVKTLMSAKVALVRLRSELLVSTPVTTAHTSADTAPDFAPLASNGQMREILVRRWEECIKCLKANAHLAATVMMGGLLEALFVARANKLPDKAPMFKAKTTPMDSQTGKPLELGKWTLRPYLDVGHELGWITKPGKDVAGVLGEYRNYVHPEKERANGLTVGEFDSPMFWDITKSLVRQLLSIR